MTDIAGKGFLQSYTHKLKVVGSNPTLATKSGSQLSRLERSRMFLPQIFCNQIKLNVSTK